MAWTTDDEGSPVSPGQCSCTQVCGSLAAVCDCGFELIDHSPYSPALVPSDYFLLPNMKKKKHLAGKQYRTDDQVISAVEDFFENQDESFYTKGIQLLKIHNTEEEYLKRMKTCSTKRLVPKSDQVSEKDKRCLNSQLQSQVISTKQEKPHNFLQMGLRVVFWKSLINSSVSLNLIQLINNQLTQLKNKLFLEILTEYHPERWSDH